MTGKNVIPLKNAIHSCRHSWATSRTRMVIKDKIDCQQERRIRHRLSEKAFNTRILCPGSSLYFVLFYYCIPDRFLGPFKNDGQVFNTVCKNCSFVSAHTCPFRQPDGWHLPRVRGRLAFFILFFCNNSHLIPFIKRISLLPLLENNRQAVHSFYIKL